MKRISKLHPKVMDAQKNINELRPAQKKALENGLLDGTNLLVCTLTASGKTLIAELAIMNSIYMGAGKGVYIVPLKALAREKYNDFREKYDVRVQLAIGDIEDKQRYDFDLLVTTSEKLDSLIRHHVPWLNDVKTIVIDEIHLMNDPSRGPTLEILLTILMTMLKNVQVIGLSATIGNAEELADWLKARLVQDSWRPVRLEKGVYNKGKIKFYP